MKYILIVLLSLIPFNNFAQDTIRIPVSVAKQIIYDLNSYDSIHAEYLSLHDLYILSERETFYKDSILCDYEEQNQIFQQQLILCNQENKQYNKQIDDLNKSIKNTKRKTNTIEIGGAIMLTLLVFHILLHG
jgi:hypothetical protein